MNNLKLFVISILFIGLSGCIFYSSKKEETVESPPSSSIDTNKHAAVSK